MRDLESFNGTLFSGKELKSIAINIKRLIGGLRGLDKYHLALSDKEAREIINAIDVLNKASSLFDKAGKVKTKKEAEHKKKIDKCIALVKASPFGQINIVEKIALFEVRKNSYSLESLYGKALSAYQAKYIIEECFVEELKSLGYDLAYQTGDIESTLKQAWERFQARLPDLVQKHAAVAAHVEALLEEKRQPR